MTITTSGGLVRIFGDEGLAANEDLAAEPGAVDAPQTDGAAGWDPYEVWRTRIKCVRDTREKLHSHDEPR
jgi:hypothetical protein